MITDGRQPLIAAIVLQGCVAIDCGLGGNLAGVQAGFSLQAPSGTTTTTEVIIIGCISFNTTSGTGSQSYGIATNDTAGISDVYTSRCQFRGSVAPFYDQVTSPGPVGWVSRTAPSPSNQVLVETYNQQYVRNKTVGQPANPSSTTSTTEVMLGLGILITPRSTGTIRFDIRGGAGQQTAAAYMTCTPRYGTGSAPANGGVAAGTTMGPKLTVQLTSVTTGENVPFSILAEVSGLAIGTQYWFDLSYATGISSDAAQLGALSYVVEEV